MRREAKDQSIADMQRAIYLHRERNIDEVMASNILKHGSFFNPVFTVLVCYYSSKVVAQDLMRKMLSMRSSTSVRKNT